MNTMKKILTVLMLSLLVFSLAFTAAADDFVQSPSANRAPEFIFGGSEDHPCDEPLIITAYGDRNQLPADLKAEIEKVYADVKDSKNLVALCADLKTLAEKKGIPTTNLSVSELFDIRDAHGDVEATFDIVLKAEALENFVGLVHYNNGTYELLEDATVTVVDGEYHLSFSVDSLSPFMVIVDTGEKLPTDDGSLLVAILAVIAIAECAALVAIVVKFILGKKFAA